MRIQQRVDIGKRADGCVKIRLRGPCVEENERIFVESCVIKNLKAAKYFIGLKKEQVSGKWKWLTMHIILSLVPI